MNPTPIPPDSKSEQPEPKVQVQVTEADTECRHALLRAYFNTKMTLLECDQVLANHRTSAVEAARAEAAKEITELKGWKDSAMEVLSGIEFQEIGKTLGLRLGSNIGPQILPAIRQLQAELSLVREELEKSEAHSKQMFNGFALATKDLIEIRAALTTSRAEHEKTKADCERLQGLNSSAAVHNKIIEAANERLVEAASIALSCFKRQLNSEEQIGTPFCGDDEHEAVAELTKALANHATSSAEHGEGEKA